MSATPAKHWQQRIIAYMLAQGYQEVPSYSVRYRKAYKRVLPDGQVRTYYIGNKGAVLCSTTETICGAFSVTDTIRQRVQLWELEQERQHATRLASPAQ